MNEKYFDLTPEEMLWVLKQSGATVEELERAGLELEKEFQEKVESGEITEKKLRKYLSELQK